MIALLAGTAKAVYPESMPVRQQVVAILLALAILGVILELVRRHKLREEYSLLWVITGFILLLLATNYDLLIWLTRAIGAVLPTSTLFFGGLIFLILVCLQFSVRLSTSTRRLKQLGQRVALLELELKKHLLDDPTPPDLPDGEAQPPRQTTETQNDE